MIKFFNNSLSQDLENQDKERIEEKKKASAGNMIKKLKSYFSINNNYTTSKLQIDNPIEDKNSIQTQVNENNSRTQKIKLEKVNEKINLETMQKLLIEYIKSFFQKPWSFIFFVNLVCWLILILAQTSKNVICPSNVVELCDVRILNTVYTKPETMYFTRYLYFAFYLMGLFISHSLGFYALKKDDKLLEKLSHMIGIVYTCIISVFTIAVIYLYLNAR